MASNQPQVKFRISEELLGKLKRFHPAYGELQQVMRVLLEDYVRDRERKIRRQVEEGLSRGNLREV